MKIRVTLKDPDTMHDAVDDYVKRATPPVGISDEEWEDLKESRAEKAKSQITSRWMRWSEYLTVEFDLEANTATVLPASAMDD